jgi:hypothetical protein
MGWVAGAALAGLGLAAAAVLLLPQGVALRAATHPAPRLRLELRLFAGLVPRIVAWDSARPRRARAAPAPAPATAPVAAAARAARRGRDRGRSPRLSRALSAAPRLAADVLVRLRIDRLRAAGRFGLDDPAETGVLWGRLVPVLMLLPPPAEVALVPEFGGPVLEGEAEAALSVVPLRLVLPLARFLWAVLRPAR